MFLKEETCDCIHVWILHGLYMYRCNLNCCVAYIVKETLSLQSSVASKSTLLWFKTYTFINHSSLLLLLHLLPARVFSSILRLLLMSPLTLLCLVILSPVWATEFVYNTNFNSTNIFLSGIAFADSSSILTLTKDTKFSIGRAFYPHIIPTKHFNYSTFLPFATSFIFSITPVKNVPTGHGFAFLLSPSKGMNGTTSNEYLGLLNFTNEGNPHNHVLGIEFDVFRNEEFDDINSNHVGIDINSLTSLTSHEAGFWGGQDDDKFEQLKMVSGESYQVWIEFMDSQINVTMARAGSKKPRRPLISENVNLSEVLLDETYVGFCGATGLLMEYTRIMAWSFSNSNFSIGDALVINNMTPQKGLLSQPFFIAVIVLVCMFSIGCVSKVLFILWRKKNEAVEGHEDWELLYWPHRISYREIDVATTGFSDENVIGIGRNGKVYKGMLHGVEVAVKRIPQETEQGMGEFLAEVSSLGRMKHRNLVGLRGWCKREKGSMILVYDYMENGSLDKRIFECEERKMLSWKERIEVLKNIATGILYLHEGWEVKVLHRDIKASNVLLDKDMNARLGDFGLARMHDHKGQIATTTRVIGTLGYIAPEVVQTGRASTSSDVFGFGVLVLEVVCGRRPIEEDKPGLAQWVMSLSEIGELHCAIDKRLKNRGGYSIEEVERLLQLGLACANAEPSVRPTMRQVVKVLEGEIECNDCEEEMEGENLLEKIKSAAMWSTSDSSRYRHYPTIETMFNSDAETLKSHSHHTIPDVDITQVGR